MDAKLIFWIAALLDLALVAILVIRGVGLARRGEVARHRRFMLGAVALVGLFLLSYAGKLGVFGREDLSVWSPLHLNALRFHETCVLVMLIGGGVAAHRAWSMRGTRRVTHRGDDPETPEATLRWHRRAGWAAATGAVLGLLSAFVVLVGMFERAV